MSILRDFPNRELTGFGGAWQLTDKSVVPLTAALKAENVEYVAGQVGTRHGFGPATFTSGTQFNARALYAWYAPVVATYGSTYSDCNLVALTTGFNVEIYNVKTTGVLGVDTGNTGASFVGVGMRLYMAHHTSAQLGASSRVGYITTGPAVSFENVFLGPCACVPTTSEPAAGLVTAGVHRIAYLMEFASGFTTRLSPDTSGSTTTPTISSFSPVSVTASGSKNLRVSFDFDTGRFLPQYPIAISIAMTTTANLNQYYIVPGSRTAYTNTQFLTIDVSISDSDLSSQGVDATPYLYWLTSAPAVHGGTNYSFGSAPFAPSHLCLWGDRMAWKTTQADNKGNLVDCVYVSERNNYQAITADQHIIFIPGQRPISTLFRMGTVNYMVGPHEIYSTTDNGDVPVTWAAPHLVDGRHGTLAIHGVEVAPSGQYAWIADQAGLFLFDGSPITGLPISYQQTDWGRINWSVAYTLQVKDDAGNGRVHVLAALDSATSPSHILTFDYTNGAEWNQVRYSLDSISGFGPGAIELVRNDLPNQVQANRQKVELWVAPATGSPGFGSAIYLRKMTDADTNPYRDNGAAIASTYRTAPLPGRGAGGLISQHHGFHARLKGSGTIAPKIYDIDATRSFTCRTVTLATAPDQDILCLADMRGELAFVEFATNTLDYYWQLAYLKYYYSPYLIQR